jgi:protein required for attachment to host cells
MKTLITVCGRAGARFFSSTGTISSMKLEVQLDHPEGKLQEHDLRSDKGGESGSSNHPGQNTLGSASSAVVHEAENFAGEIVAWLERGRIDHLYDKYIIVADATFTGQLRNKMNTHVLAMVTDFVGKDLQKETLPQIGTHLTEVLAP